MIRMHAGDTRAARNPGRGAAAPQHQPRTGRHPVHSLGIWPTSGSAQPLVAPASGPGRPRSVRAPRAASARCRNPRLERSPRRCSSAWATALWDGDGAITFPLNNGTITESGPHRIAIDVTDTSGSFLVGINRASATDPVHDLGFVWPGHGARVRERTGRPHLAFPGRQDGRDDGALQRGAPQPAHARSVRRVFQPVASERRRHDEPVQRHPEGGRSGVSGARSSR